jgi:transcriptional regulator NrdR family protein
MCPLCKGPVKVLETRECKKQGGKRRRLRCKTCLYRFTLINDAYKGKS